MRETICWNCRNSCNSDKCHCSWSEKFEPVEGWEVEETSFKNKGCEEMTKSYCVISCPLFIADKKSSNKLFYTKKTELFKDMADFFKVSIRTIQRNPDKYFANFEKEFGKVCLCF